MRIRWRGLELPSRVACDSATLTVSYGKFTAEPFERGFGTTVGNSLRRVLLSSLEGSAVTRMKIKNALHEFTSITGVLEDVTEIALNVKSLVVKSLDDKQKVIRIEKNTAGIITGADIITDGSVEIINKSHHIATLTSNVSFEMEMVVENGRGYIPASEQLLYMRDKSNEIGFIPLDAAFSPVVRVQYQVEETRVGQKTNYDKLILQIWTDGSITPNFALIEASKILRKHLNPFVQYDRTGADVFARPKTLGTAGVLDPAIEEKLKKLLSDPEINLSVRARNCLEAEQINTVRDLVTHTEDSLLEFRNFGETTLNEVKEKLAVLGLRLGMRVPALSASVSHA